MLANASSRAETEAVTVATAAKLESNRRKMRLDASFYDVRPMYKHTCMHMVRMHHICSISHCLRVHVNVGMRMLLAKYRDCIM